MFCSLVKLYARYLIPKIDLILTSCHQDLDKDDYVPEPYRLVDPLVLYGMNVEERKEKEKTSAKRAKKLQNLGFEAEHAGEILF